MSNPETPDSQARALTAFLRNLRAADLDSFASTAVASACTDLGFCKAMFSWVDGPAWRPAAVFVSPTLDTVFDDLIDAVDGSAVPLLRAPREADLVRYRRPFILGKKDYRHSYRPLIDLSYPAAYAAAPIVAFGRTVAILHVDHHADAVGPEDLTLLARSAHLCSLSYSTLERRARVRDQQTAVRTALAAVSPPSGHPAQSDRIPLSDMVFGTSTTASGTAAPVTTGPIDSLTDREHEVLRLLATGASNRSIAEHLYISDGTVKSHVHRIFRKVGVQTRAQATALYRARTAHTSAS
ncbi:helix-turn-helix transcriptional regulator [Gordonia desulfuricans]|uniref:Helix-turn-helix transcriptional regulator n=1 Tax=Gordonia desulfuricans TaxID=89051 RepID=A0A7K3LLN0_9ACTN|nr:helix-turn-helix transcriptional regulator [Gordonia desulfuricans]NDK89144.1 helix-turn-helix transcriptional regulator [Gordonia desulfuricans]